VTDSRRGLLLAAAAAVAAGQAGTAPVHAAQSPDQLEVSGMQAPRQQVNGRWSKIFGTEVNERSVYKKNGENIYLVYNDCGQFSFSDKVTGSCDGWGTEKKGLWTVDGKKAETVKVKPVKPVGVKNAAAEAPKDGPNTIDVGGSFSSMFQLPKIGLTGKETDEELLFDGVNVVNYIRAKGGENFLENAMKMDDDESALADKLSDKLGGFSARLTNKVYVSKFESGK